MPFLLGRYSIVIFNFTLTEVLPLFESDRCFFEMLWTIFSNSFEASEADEP